jgi:hypothetical protein
MNDLPGIIGVLTGFGLVVIVPVVALLLNHQRKMAEIVHGDQRSQAVSNDRLARLEAEVAGLRQLITDNILALDDRREAVPMEPPAMPPSERQENVERA